MTFLEPGRRAPRRRGARRPVLPLGPMAVLVLVVVVAGAVGVAVIRHRHDLAQQRDAARRYTRAWAARDVGAMWAALDPQARQRYPLVRFHRLVGFAETAATVVAIRPGPIGGVHGGVVDVPVVARTRWFGALHGVVHLPVSKDGVAWSPALRLPGLRPGEAVRRRTLRSAHGASVLTADGLSLADDPVLSPFGPGLERRFAARLNGRPGGELLFGRRVVARVAPRAGHSVRSTMRRTIQLAAEHALGAKLGGVAVVRPSDGSVLALAGIAVSAPQPPGSTFKIITLSGVLAAGIAGPSSSYPVATSATLSGVKLANANNEACGGSLSRAFADSCNSVFAPLGAKLGAQRLVARAEAFGFNEQPRIPVAKPSTIPPARELPDDLAVGSSAIGQDKDLATPLEMASVAAAIGEHGIRAMPRAVSSDPVRRRRAVSARVAAEVRAMMLGVVRSGTGTAAAIPGVQVAGKTGTAELRFTGNGTSDPKNTDAWFVAFAPAQHPRVAVGVMLVGAGFGGQTAAPIARQVLLAALKS